MGVVLIDKCTKLHAQEEDDAPKKTKERRKQHAQEDMKHSRNKKNVFTHNAYPKRMRKRKDQGIELKPKLFIIAMVEYLKVSYALVVACFAWRKLAHIAGSMSTKFIALRCSW